ncbi:MAG: NeuD/PglB/VioB family sugar acetyltransferase [Cyclobacteriaceae bacterium]|nr:NeuD/PglB/VioB family sugar acetyltransferase [Cyclobacteriaceae bacterium]
MDNPVIILGANGLGKAAKEIFESHEIVIFGFLDDNKSLHNAEIGDVSVLGSTTDDGYLKYIGKKCQAFVAEDNNTARKSMVKVLNDRRKVMPVNAIHSQAYISSSAHIGHGNFINAGVTIGANAKIESHCLLHANSVIDFDVEIGEYVQIGAGSIIGSSAKIESEVFIGSGATIVSGVTIEKGARIGAGSVVISDVSKGDTVFGNPAQPIKK